MFKANIAFDIAILNSLKVHPSHKNGVSSAESNMSFDQKRENSVCESIHCLYSYNFQACSTLASLDFSLVLLHCLIEANENIILRTNLFTIFVDAITDEFKE